MKLKKICRKMDRSAHSGYFIIENNNLWLKVGQTKKQFNLEYESVCYFMNLSGQDA